MGLDTVELLVEVEKTFDIKIPDLEAEKIITVGDFYDVVWEKIKQKKSSTCKSAMLYYKFRRTFESRYGIAKHNFKPDTLLDTIIPKNNRKYEWKTIQNDFELKLPELILPKWLNHSLFYFGFLSILGGLLIAFIAIALFNASYYWWLIPVAGVALTLLLNKITRPLRTELEQKNVRELIEKVLALNYKQLSDLLGTNREEMEKVMTLIIYEKAGVEFSEIRREASITKDLGMD